VALRDAIRRNAEDYASALKPVVDTIRAEGHSTLRAIAAELYRRSIATRRGGHWQVSNVRNLLARLEGGHD
jgi:hypothetical protein